MTLGNEINKGSVVEFWTQCSVCSIIQRRRVTSDVSQRRKRNYRAVLMSGLPKMFTVVTWNAIFLYFVEITEQNHEQPQPNHTHGGYNRTGWNIDCGSNRPVGQHSGKCSGTNSISPKYGQPSMLSAHSNK